MRIVHVIFSMNIGGAESMLVDILNEQCKDNNVSIIILNDSFNNHLLSTINSSVNIITINRKPRTTNPLYICKLNYLLLDGKYDIIHCHNSYILKLFFFGRLYKRIIYTAHDVGLDIRCPKKIYHTIAISKAVAEDLSSRYTFPITIIPNGIAIDRIVKRSFKVIGKSFKIINVARLYHEKKGQDVLIKAVKILCDKGYNVNVDFVGEGPSLSYLTNLSRKLDISENIKFLGAKDREYIYNHLRDYEMMCHPSIFEGFGLSIIEAMSASIPVLVSNEGGPIEIIKNGQYGYSFINRDYVSCALMIEHIINNYDEAIKKSRPAYEYVVENFSIENMCKKYDNIYHL